jgi:hypothetical protein
VFWLALSFITIPAALSLRFFSYLAGPDRVPQFLLGLAILVGAATAVLAFVLLTSPPLRVSDRAGRLAGGILGALSLAWLLYLIVGTHKVSVLAIVLVLGAAAAFALAMVSRARAGTIAALGAVASLVIAFQLVSAERFAESSGDMLDLIDLAVTRVLAGDFPYQDLRVPGAELSYSGRPVPYPPVMWLVYLPFEAAGLDLRLLPLLATGLVGLLLWRTAARGAVAPLADALMPALFLAPIFVLRVISIQTPPHWLLVCGIVLAVSAGVRAPWVGVATGVALGMRETTLVIVPLLVLYYWVRRPREAIEFVAALTVTSAAIFVPFLLVDARAFVSCMTYNAAYVVQLERPLNHIGFGPWIANAAGPGAATALQAILCCSIYFFAYRRMREPAELSVLMGIAYLVFMLFNPLIHEYYYLPGLILISLGLFLAGDPRRPWSLGWQRAAALVSERTRET